MRDTIELAREADCQHINLTGDYAKSVERLKAFEALVRADERNRTWTQEDWTEYERSIAATEREACAKVCDSWSLRDSLAAEMAEEIRARGNT